MKPLIARALALLMLVLTAQGSPLSGTKSVGPTGDYTSLTAAIAEVNAVGNGLGGALVLELQANYVSSVETFPLTIPALDGASAVNTLTIRPASDAIGLSIASAAAQTVDLNGAQFVTIDGRPGGVGSNAGSGGGGASQLTIANTNTGAALRFINDASGNILRFTTLRGSYISALSGTVLFSTTTGASGNDNNSIDHCDISDGASTPSYGIFSLGTTTTPEQANSGNTVSNCNIFNFDSRSDGQAAGVSLYSGNTDWTITGNSFFQTASRMTTFGQVYGILLSAPMGNNFTVTGNFIGGSGPSAGGTSWATWRPPVLGFNYRFVGIYLHVGNTTPSNVHGNKIQNIIWTSTSNAAAQPGVWSGILVSAGSANVGTLTGNTVGSGTGTGSISVSTAGNGGTTFGIGSVSADTVAIANNAVGSITTNGVDANGNLSTGVSVSLTGISATAGANTISNNTVGSTTATNSLNAATSSISTTRQQVTGILCSSSTSASITGNTVANLNNNSVQTLSGLGQICGIVTSAGMNTITGNTVRNLSTTSQNAGVGPSASVLGISQSSTVEGQTVSQNTVHSLANMAATGNVTVHGIYYTGATGGTNLIARNLVHSLTISSTEAFSQLLGMFFSAGSFTAQNNMVRVGLKADGTSTAGTSVIRGILESGTTEGRNFYHNSVYIGGTHIGSSMLTSAFYSAGSGNARTFENNIFVNARSNSGTTTKHYAVFYSNASLNGLTAGGNLLLASGTGGVLGNYSGNRATLAAWQAATGQDATSLNVDPLFVNPTGDAATVDLHIPATSPQTTPAFPSA